MTKMLTKLYHFLPHKLTSTPSHDSKYENRLFSPNDLPNLKYIRSHPYDTSNPHPYIRIAIPYVLRYKRDPLGPTVHPPNHSIRTHFLSYHPYLLPLP